MQTDLLILAAGGSASLAMVGFSLRTASRDTRLHRRIAALAMPHPGGALVEDDGPAQLRWLEVMLLCAGQDRKEIAQSLQAADLTHPRAVLVFAAIRLVATVLAGAATAVLLHHSQRLAGIARIYPFAAAAVMFVGSKIALRSRTAARTRRISKELPFALDVMLLMLESGVSLDQCFRQLAQWDANAVPTIQRTMSVMVDDLQRGMAYEAALDRWAERMVVNGARELASLFRQTILHGTELAPALRNFVIEFSERRITKAREVIGKKTTQMTIVMITFLMPALMIVIAGPAVVAVFGAFRSMTP